MSVPIIATQVNLPPKNSAAVNFSVLKHLFLSGIRFVLRPTNLVYLSSAISNTTLQHLRKLSGSVSNSKTKPEKMASATSPNPMFMDLWKQLFEVIIEPALDEDLATSDPMRGLPSRLQEQCYDENFYPFIYDCIIRELEVYCKDSVLPKLLNLRDIDLIMATKYFCMKDIHSKTLKLWYPIQPLERTYAYLITRNPKRQFPSIERRAGDVFRRVVYRNIADILREAAFECITETLTIECEFALTSYLEVLYYIRTNDHKFFDEEWNTFALSRITWLIHGSSTRGSNPFSGFMKCAENFLVSSNVIFQLAAEEYRESLDQFLYWIRDRMIFGNDAQLFKRMLEESDGEMLMQAFNIFEHDEEFPKIVAFQSMKLFSELVQGKDPNPNEDHDNHERDFRQLFSLWLRLQHIHENGDRNGQTIREVLIVPFVAVINSKYPQAQTIMRVIAKYSEQLFSNIRRRQKELVPEGIKEIIGILSLVSFLPISDTFHIFFRALLSKTLLKDTTEPVKIDQLQSMRSSLNQMDIVSDILAMLDDARAWPLFEVEMLPTVQTFGLRYGKLDFEPMVVRRFRWDLESDVGLVFPRKLRLLSRIVLNHIHSRYPMRRASIHSSMGEMEITAKFWSLSGNFVRIKLSTAQGCVLTLFEENDEFSIRKLANSVLSTCGELSSFNAVVAIIKSMMKEHKIFLKRPQNSKFCETDIIFLNRHFEPKSENITLPSVEYYDENQKGLQAIVKNTLTRYHKMVMEASIMKILKEERVLTLQTLKEIIYFEHMEQEESLAPSFEELIERLERDEYLTVDNTIVRYKD